jgi:hypothetical protein
LQESLTRVVDLPEDNPDIVRLFLSVLYMGNYPDTLYGPASTPNAAALQPMQNVLVRLSRPYHDTPLDENDGNVVHKAYRGKKTPQFHQLLAESLAVAVQVYVIADKYQVPHAQLLALERLYRNMEYILDENECGSKCEEDCLADGVAEAIDFVYSHTTPDAISKCAIRQSLATMIKRHIEIFHGRSKILVALEHVIQEHTDLALDLGRNSGANKRKGSVDEGARKMQRT